MLAWRQHAVVVGAGCAGLAMAVALDHVLPGDWRITVVDPTFRSASEKTWCFWGEVPEHLAPLVRKTWTKSRVAGPGWSRTDPLRQHPYHLVEGAAYERHHLERLRRSPRVRLRHGAVDAICSRPHEGADVRIDGTTLPARWVFQSVRRPPNATAGRTALAQHFGGWLVETQTPVFSPDRFTLMDFDAEQGDGVAFRYVLPLSETRALVEHTVFSRAPWARTRYDAALRTWLDARTPSHRVERREYGVIPMRDDELPQQTGHSIFNLGTVGGMTKPSTGYTFANVHRQVGHLCTTLLRRGRPRPLPSRPRRFAWYDALLLDVLARTPERGRPIFERLFQGHDVDGVLGFLDERSSIPQEASIFSSLPWAPFLAAASRRRAQPRLALGPANP